MSYDPCGDGARCRNGRATDGGSDRRTRCRAAVGLSAGVNRPRQPESMLRWHCCIGTERDGGRSPPRFAVLRIVTRYAEMLTRLRLSGGPTTLRDWPFG